MKLKSVKLGVGISILLFLFEIFLVIKLEIQTNIILTIFLYILLLFVMCYLLKYPMSEKKNISYYTRGISNFMYYSHPLFMIMISSVFSKILHASISGTILFVLTILGTGIIGYIIIKINNKYVNKFLF